MRIAVFGTGMVGRVLAAKLADLGHDVTVGTRDPQATLARDESDRMGNPPFAQWRTEHGTVGLENFADAAAAADLIVNATSGSGSLAALGAAGAGNLDGKVLLDAANALDYSAGFPPTLTVANTDSLAEQIQAAYPAVRVVKCLNTVNCLVMVEPSRVPGDHQIFVAGEDESAKRAVTDLVQTFGWPAGSIIDLGGIRAARGLEMYMPLWLSLMGVVGNGDFNINVVRPAT